MYSYKIHMGIVIRIESFLDINLSNVSIKVHCYIMIKLICR